jgi:hypothetical protein
MACVARPPHGPSFWKSKKDKVDEWVKAGGAVEPVETDKKRKE